MSLNAVTRFPNPGWAWPSEERQAMLRAALLPDADEARREFEAWLATHDIDALGFADHRLLAAISERHGKTLARLPAYPRVQGLQRQIWTQSRLRVHHVLPTLEKLTAAGIEVMLLKGAARIALRPEAQRQRAHQDVDILVREDHIQAAAQILNAEGWQTVRGDTALAAMARAPGARAINFQKLPWGDIDLHRFAYHGGNHHPQMDAAVWTRAHRASYFGLPVLVPEPAERLAMILSHGAWSPEAHSDWLLDAADILACDAVDWPYFAKLVAKRGMGSQVKIGLSYLHAGLGLALPEQALSMIKGRCALPTLLVARDASTLPGWLRPIRRLFYIWGRAQRQRGSHTAIPPRQNVLARGERIAPQGATWTESAEVVSRPLPAGRYRFTAELVIQAPKLRRRIELELNSATHNLAKFRVFAAPCRSGALRVTLSARLQLAAPCDTAQLLARPGKLLGAGAGGAEVAKYAALPFVLTKLDLRRD